MDINSLKMGDIICNHTTSESSRKYMIYTNKYTPYIMGYESNGNRLRKVRYLITDIESIRDGQPTHEVVGHSTGFEVLLNDLNRLSKPLEVPDIVKERSRRIDASFVDTAQIYATPVNDVEKLNIYISPEVEVSQEKTDEWDNSQLSTVQDILLRIDDKSTVLRVATEDTFYDDRNMVTIDIEYI